MTAHVQTRRELLRRGSVGSAVAGAAWVAPAIFSTPASAGGSCACGGGSGSLDWTGTNENKSFSGAPSPLSLTFDTSIAGFTMQLIPGTGADWYSEGFARTQPPTTQQGATTNNFLLSLGLDGTGASVPAGSRRVLEMRFCAPVSNLRFSVADVDSAGTTPIQYQDRVGFTPGPSSFTFGPGTPVTATGTNPFDGNTALSAGNRNAPANTTRGNVNLVFNGPISIITIKYSALLTIPAAQDQKVAITRMTWDCP